MPSGVRREVLVARLAGRSTWFAWLTGLCCLAIVVGLVGLAAPLAPAVADWTMRTAGAFGERVVHELTRGGETAQEQVTTAAGELPASCDALALAPALHAVLGSDAAAGPQAAGVPHSAGGLVGLLGAQPVLDCLWGTAGSTAHAWLATTSGDAAAADELLRAIGFECARLGDALRCTRSAAAEGATPASTVTHLLRDGTWMIASTTGAGVDGFTAAGEGAIWPEA